MVHDDIKDTNTEVSKKVKSAIMAKLTELRTYVDNELPDYIMIMIGNKRTQAQMIEDLRLFLGKNTEEFTAWLHGVLQKLNAAALLKNAKTVKVKEKKKEEEKPVVVEEVEVPKEKEEKKKHKKKKDKSERKKEKKEKKKKEKHKQAKLSKKERSKSKSLSPPEATTSSEATTKVPKPPSSPPSPPPPPPPAEDDAKPPSDPESPQILDEEEDAHHNVVDLRPNADDLALGLEDEPLAKRPKTKAPQREVTSQVSSNNALNTQITNFEIKVSNPDAELVKEPPQVEAITPSVHDRLGAPNPAPITKRIINLREESSFPQKSSSEGIGRVVSSAIASAVKSVAVTVANASSETKTAKKLEARVRPLLSSRINVEEETDTVALPPPRVVSKVGAVLKRAHTNDDSDDAEEPVAKKMSGVASKVEQVAPRPRRTGSSQANTALILRAVADAHKSVSKPSRRAKEEEKEESGKKELFTRSYQERQSQRLAVPKDAKGSKKLAITVPNSYLKDGLEVAQIGSKRTMGDTYVKESEMEEDLHPGEEPLEQMEESEVPAKLVPDAKPLAMTKVIPMQMDDPARNTQFIVTLDGLGNEVAQSDLRARLSGRPVRTPSVDEEEFIEEVEVWEEEVEEMEGVTPQSEIPQSRIAATGVSFAPKWKTKIDASNLYEKKEERCRFWPACKQGAACPFIHPSKVCTNFPSCRFGDKCIYIHPNCKFDASCTKPNCPFTHTTPRTLGIPAPVVALKPRMPTTKSKIKCRYYPKCVDMNCPFMHPKQICRYGKSCQTPSCLFVHPDVTTGALLKWTAPKIPTSAESDTTALTSATDAVSSEAPLKVSLSSV